MFFLKKKKKLEDFLDAVRLDISSKDFTSFKIGGKVKYFFEASIKEDIVKAVKLAKELRLPFLIIGGGTNILFPDKDFKGLIIKISNKEIRIEDKRIYIEAGAKLSFLVQKASEECLSGLEWAAGIPGTVGGAVYGNAGAFDKSMEDNIEEIEALDINELKIKKLKKEECNFNYKSSIFKERKNLIILSLLFKFKKEEREKIKKEMERFKDLRIEKHPLDYPSAGCIFKNVFIKIKNEKLLKEFPELNTFNEKGFIPAGYLIEKCGLKSKQIAQAQISEKHANFIINLGNAKAENIISLIKLIKKEVKKKFNINLEEEIILF